MNYNIPAITGGLIVALAVASTGVLFWFFIEKRKPKITLVDRTKKVQLRIINRQLITHDTMMLQLSLDSPDHVLGLPVGNHVYLSASVNGSLVVRPYTPISLDTQKGRVDFVIKIYKAGIHPKFPDGGKMSQFLMTVPINHYISVRGPAGNLHYRGKGKFAIKPDASSSPKMYNVKFVNMICGGSGITPMFQLLKYILNDKNDSTKLSLIFANQTEKDIILRDELDAFVSEHPSQFRLWYTVTQAPEAWEYSTGHVTDTIFAEHLYPPGNDCLVLLCGPAPMVEIACYPNLAKLNYSRDQTFVF